METYTKEELIKISAYLVKTIKNIENTTTFKTNSLKEIEELIDDILYPKAANSKIPDNILKLIL